MGKAIVLLSGGQDSTTCLFWALKNFNEVEAIGFNYGQKHAKELDCAKLIAERANVPFQVINLEGVLGGSSLVDHQQDVNSAHHINAALPSSFTAGRNMVFLAVAAGLAYNRKAMHIVTGICQTDYSGYPDCRENFRAAMQVAASLALDSDIVVHAPLMWLTKAETWKLAAELSTPENNVVEIVRSFTLTDYNGNMQQNEWGMGELNNPASELRAKGYFEAKELGWI